MKLTITTDMQQPSDEDLQSLERDLGSTLPAPYRRFLREYNGGTPVPGVFGFIQDGRENNSTVREFFCVTGEGANSVRSVLETYKNRVPKGLLPVASDPCGNLVCLGISGGERGQVYFWDHDYESEEDEAPDSSNVYLVSNDFDTFLSSLSTL